MKETIKGTSQTRYSVPKGTTLGTSSCTTVLIGNTEHTDVKAADNRSNGHIYFTLGLIAFAILLFVVLTQH